MTSHSRAIGQSALPMLDTPEQRLRDTLGLLIPYTEVELSLLRSEQEQEDV